MKNISNNKKQPLHLVVYRIWKKWSNHENFTNQIPSDILSEIYAKAWEISSKHSTRRSFYEDNYLTDKELKQFENRAAVIIRNYLAQTLGYSSWNSYNRDKNMKRKKFKIIERDLKLGEV